MTFPPPVHVAASPTRYSATNLSPLMGSKRSALNYSFRMSNNACWLLFRVGGGGDPLNNSGPMILFLSLRKKRGSVVQMFESYLGAGGLCCCLADLGRHRSNSVGGTEGGLASFHFTQASSSMTAGSWLLRAKLPPETSLQYSMCHDSPGCCQRLKEHEITPLQWGVLLF